MAGVIYLVTYHLEFQKRSPKSPSWTAPMTLPSAHYTIRKTKRMNHKTATDRKLSISVYVAIDDITYSLILRVF